MISALWYEQWYKVVKTLRAVLEAGHKMLRTSVWGVWFCMETLSVKVDSKSGNKLDL